MKTLLQDAINEKADEHESAGGAVVTVLINGNAADEVRICLDEHGKACDAYSEVLLKIHPLKP